MEEFRRSMPLQQQVLVQIQKAGPDGDQPSVRTALRVTERADEIGPPSVPTAEPQLGPASQNQSDRSAVPRPALTPCPGRNGR
jgi:hypothetical protein